MQDDDRRTLLQPCGVSVRPGRVRVVVEKREEERQVRECRHVLDLSEREQNVRLADDIVERHVRAVTTSATGETHDDSARSAYHTCPPAVG